MTVNAIPLRCSVLLCPMEPNAETIGDRIFKLRKEKGISRGELAKDSGLAYSTLADIENGLQNSSTKLHKVAKRLNVRIEYLESGAPPIQETGGVREPGLERPIDKLKIHDVHCSRDG